MIAERTLVASVASQMKVVPVEPFSPAASRLIDAYHAKYGIGPRSAGQERAQQWAGVEYEGKVVFVFAIRQEGHVLEVTDAYHDGSRLGVIAFHMVAMGYYKMLQDGKIDRLIHSCLHANTEEWQAVMKATGDPPYALVFVHERKVQ